MYRRARARIKNMMIAYAVLYNKVFVVSRGGENSIFQRQDAEEFRRFLSWMAERYAEGFAVIFFTDGGYGAGAKVDESLYLMLLVDTAALVKGIALYNSPQVEPHSLHGEPCAFVIFAELQFFPSYFFLSRFYVIL